MSDSDDTDVLLLIPPDFFVAEAASSVYSEFMANENISPIPIENQQKFNYCCSNSLELKHLNREISKLEQECPYSDNITSNSSYCKQRLDSVENHSFLFDYQRMNNLSPSKLHHSTPKNTSIQQKLDFVPKSGAEQSKYISPPPPPYRNQKFLKEIDYFLYDNNSPSNNNTNNDFASNNVHALASEALKKHSNMLDAQHSRQFHTAEYQDNINISKRFADENKTQVNWPKNSFNVQENGSNLTAKPLISLCDIWGPEGQTETPSLHEERLRREHCEKHIQNLQVQLLEYQQKISVAIKIDKSKDEAIAKLHAANKSLSTKIVQLEDTISDIENKLRKDSEKIKKENVELKEKQKLLGKELCDALGMAKQYQEHNEQLENNNQSLSMTLKEIRDVHRNQLKDMEKRFVNNKNQERKFNEEIEKVNEQNRQIVVDLEKAKESSKELQKKYDELQSEIEILRQQKSTIHVKLKEERSRADILEKDRKSLRQTVESLNDKERNFLKELETQRQSLKSFYQQQLEQVVREKLKEFQNQIDTVEETLKSDAKQRELLIAERAIKQMELINEKNDQEVALINEKHHEEIELYRIQLANAASTIKQLQDKLNAYQSKRADIAEKLHNIMETQWQKTLEIITNPNTNANNMANAMSCERNQSMDPSKIDKNKLDGVTVLYRNNAENETFETPTTSRHKKKTDQLEYTDKLHAYIDLLLQKSPSDLDQLDTILNTVPTGSNQMPKTQSQPRKDTPFKRPWK